MDQDTKKMDFKPNEGHLTVNLSLNPEKPEQPEQVQPGQPFTNPFYNGSAPPINSVPLAEVTALVFLALIGFWALMMFSSSQRQLQSGAKQPPALVEVSNPQRTISWKNATTTKDGQSVMISMQMVYVVISNATAVSAVRSEALTKPTNALFAEYTLADVYREMAQDTNTMDVILKKKINLEFTKLGLWVVTLDILEVKIN